MSQCPVPAMPQDLPTLITMHRDLTADEVEDLKRKLVDALAKPWQPIVLPFDDQP